jgi:hypothetical protein
MTFSDFLEDLDAREADDWVKFKSDWRASKPGETRTYPPPSRFQGLKRPISVLGNCTLWGILPFSGSVLIDLYPSENPTKFDAHHARWGYCAADIPALADLARRTKRIGFRIAGPAPNFAHLDFLEPIFREFDPTRLFMLSLDDIVDYKTTRPFRLAFRDLARTGFTNSMLASFQTAASGGVEQFEQIMSEFGQTYALINVLGKSDLVEEVENLMTDDPMIAEDLLIQIKDELLSPLVSVDETERTLTTLEFRVLQHLRGQPGSHAFPEDTPPNYESGMFLLSQLVHYPDSRDGCLRILQEYDSVGLSKAREDLYQSVLRRSPGAVTKSATEVERACQDVWDRLERYSWVERAASLTPMVSVGILSFLATGLPDIALLSGVGMDGADRVLGRRFGSTLKGPLAKALGVRRMVSLYDFKTRSKA